MKNRVLFLTLFTTLPVLINAAEKQSTKASFSFQAMPMDPHWFVKAGERYLVTCAISEMGAIQQKYPTLQCRHQVNLDSSSSMYVLCIPEDFSDSLLEQLKKEKMHIEKPRSIFPVQNT